MRDVGIPSLLKNRESRGWRADSNRSHLSQMVLAEHAVHALAFNDDSPRSAEMGVDLDVGALFEQALDAVVIARLSTGRIVMWNPAAEKLFGYTARDAI